ncbi:hypothetical protein EDD17DRAFT_1513728 [Pisolithus thermaeus]|nr:hypothetical protein EDD17DRAFT_1513728 [Pisolithus thermaeus]
MGIPNGFGDDFSWPNVVLFGLRHTYMYFMHYSEDASTTKFLVIAIWWASEWLSLASQHTAQGWIVCHALYYYLIANYAVPATLEYIVWFLYLPFQGCFPLMRYDRSFPAFSLSPSSEVVGDCSNYTIRIRSSRVWHSSWVIIFQSYALIPCATAIVVGEVLITLSLCILLYDNGSHSAFPRTKRILNTLVIYAVNRCLLTLVFTVAELVTIVDNQDAWAVGLDFNIGKLYANSLLASLNTRQYLRAQVSDPKPDLAINAVHFSNSPKLSEDEETPKGGKRHPDVREMAIIDVAALPTFDRTTVLRRKGEVQF